MRCFDARHESVTQVFDGQICIYNFSLYLSWPKTRCALSLPCPPILITRRCGMKSGSNWDVLKFCHIMFEAMLKTYQSLVIICTIQQHSSCVPIVHSERSTMLWELFTWSNDSQLIIKCDQVDKWPFLLLFLIIYLHFWRPPTYWFFFSMQSSMNGDSIDTESHWNSSFTFS